MLKFFINILVCLCSITCVAQIDSTQLYKKRSTIVYTTYTSGLSTSMIGLYSLWYKDYPQTSFHLFNDNDQWLGMDKLGHGMSAYYISGSLFKSFRYAGKSQKRSIIQGSIGSLLFLTGIEVLDGFSPAWGFSVGDMGSNILGVGLYASQEFLWEEQRVVMKFSSSPSKYAKYRPDLLGTSYIQKVLKDYNGQTYWLSAGVKEFIPNASLPKWINIAFGYSGDGMLGGKINPGFNENGQLLPQFQRNREYLLSLDIDLRDIPTNKRWVKSLLTTFNFIKIPFPTIGIRSNGKFIARGFYF